MNKDNLRFHLKTEEGTVVYDRIISSRASKDGVKYKFQVQVRLSQISVLNIFVALDKRRYSV